MTANQALHSDAVDRAPERSRYLILKLKADYVPL